MPTCDHSGIKTIRDINDFSGGARGHPTFSDAAVKCFGCKCVPDRFEPAAGS